MEKYYLIYEIKTNSRNQDSGKVFYLEKQEYVDSCGTHIFRLLLTILANLSVPQHQGHRHRIRLTKGKNTTPRSF